MLLPEVDNTMCVVTVKSETAVFAGGEDGRMMCGSVYNGGE